MKNDIGHLNPIRYRGYYWDSETNLYYLQSRYYDPTTMRFINADGYFSTGQGTNSHNMFAYCENNPVMYSDPTGEFLDSVFAFFNNLVSTITSWTPAYAGCGAAAVADGPFLFGDALALIGAGAVTLGAIAVAGYNTITGSDSKAKSEEKDTAPKLPSSTVIYRYGETNPGNLTPKEKDKYTGLSFSTVPKPGCSMTTIEALNATGVVYAVRDGATHVSVKPIGGSIEDWVKAGSNSVWTQAVKSVVVKWDGIS